jgi:hypothetical protein
MTPSRNSHTHRESDKPDVVVDGKTTLNSSVSIALIASKLIRVGVTVVWRRTDQSHKSPGEARDGLP